MSEFVLPTECKAILEFGKGRLTAHNGMLYGIPMLAITPAKHPGEVGASAEFIETSVSDEDAMKDAVVMLFPTERQRDAVIKALRGIDI